MADLAVWQRTIVDEEGNVIPGAEVEVRREEDGSLATLYADRAGETPLANPLAADMSGFVRFFAQGDAYTITAVGAGSTRTWRFDPTGRLQEFDRVSDALNTADGADTLETRKQLGTFSSVAEVQSRHIPPVLDSIRTNGYYAPGDGGGALYKRVSTEPAHGGKIQSADGAWWEIAETVVSVRMFGAVGDGTTDDSPAFRAAVSLRTHVYIPPGTYSVREIQVPSRTIIQGAGIGVTVLRHRPKDGNHFPQRNFLFQIGDLDDDTVTSDRHVIRDMTIRGDSADHPANHSGASSLIQITRTALYTLENLVLNDSAWKGIDIYNLMHAHDPTNNSLIQNVRIFNCRGEGLYIRSRVRGVQVDNLIVGVCDGNGVVIDHSEGQYSNIRSTRNGGRGIWIRNVTTVNMVNMTAVGNGEHGIVVDRNVGVTGSNWISYNNSQSLMNGFADVFFTADDSSYGRTRNMSIEGLAVGSHNWLGGGVSGTDNQRANIWFEDPDGETVYENITINGLSVATPPDDQSDSLTSRSSVILLPNVKSTIFIDGDRHAVASTYSPVIDLDFVNDEYRRYETGDGLRFVDRADILDHQRASSAWYVGPDGNWEEAAVDTPRFGFLDGVDRGFVDGYLHENGSENLAWPTGAAETCVTTVESGETYTLSFYRSGQVTLSGAHSAVVDGLSGARRASYTFTANGTSLTLTPSGDVFNWQLEKGERPTTLIKTTSGPVTRVKDFLRVEVPASMPSDQGTLFIDCRLNQFNANVGLLDHYGGLRITQAESAFSDYALRITGPAGPTDQIFVAGRGFEFGQRMRIAVAWVNNAQGCLVSMAAQGNLWRHLEQHDVPVDLLTPRYLGIFNRRNFEPETRSESGVVYRVSMYPTALTAQAMRALTRAG